MCVCMQWFDEAFKPGRRTHVNDAKSTFKLTNDCVLAIVFALVSGPNHSNMIGITHSLSLYDPIVGPIAKSHPCVSQQNVGAACDNNERGCANCA